MEDIKTINTKIPIEKIIQKTLNSNPKSQCEFNNLLVYNSITSILQGLELQNGGSKYKSKEKKKVKSKTNIKNKLTKYKNKLNKMKRNITRKERHLQKGGVNSQFILFLIGILLVLVKGIKNVTDTEVIQRLKQANEVSDIFRNYYGTCTLNTMLFLKTIDLPTFEDLSVTMMTQNSGLTSNEMLPYLNKELNVKGKFALIFGKELTPELKEIDLINAYINKIRDKLIAVRSEYGYNTNQPILTAMGYPKKDKSVGHSVVIWLTSDNEVILIDVQKFISSGIVLYTSELTTKKFLNNDKQLKLDSLRIYIRENIDIYNDIRDTYLLTSLHIELDDIYEKNKLSITNQNLINTIAKIKEIEEGLDVKGLEEL